MIATGMTHVPFVVPAVRPAGVILNVGTGRRPRLGHGPRPPRALRPRPAGRDPGPSPTALGDARHRADPASIRRGYREDMSHGPRSGLTAVSSALLAMSRHLEVRDVLKTIVASARELLDAQYAALGVPDDHGGFAQFVVDGVSDEQWKAIGPLPRQHGILAAMLHEATPERLADVRKAPASAAGPPPTPTWSTSWACRSGTRRGARGPVPRQQAAPCGGRPPTPPVPQARGRLRLHRGRRGTARHPRPARRHRPHHARLYERSRELTIAEERSRLAHELHDAVSQKLFSLRLTAQAATALVDRDPARAKDELHQVATLAAEAADELRAAVVELRPAALEEDGLVATLRTQIQVLDRAHAARVTFTGHGVKALPAAQEEAMLRVAQEALHNALRHSGAERVTVTLHRRGTATVLRIADNGGGFDPRTVRRAGRHLGLVSMRDRANGTGGRLTVRSAPGEGTTIEMEVPGG